MCVCVCVPGSACTHCLNLIDVEGSLLWQVVLEAGGRSEEELLISKGGTTKHLRVFTTLSRGTPEGPI